MRNILKFLVIFVVTACTSVPIRPISKPLCVGKSPTQKYIWTISFFQGIPKGMPLEQVSNLAKRRSELQDGVSDSAVGAFLFLSSNRSKNNVGLSDFGEVLTSRESAALIETGATNFVFCLWDDCSKLRDPITGAGIKMANGRLAQLISSFDRTKTYPSPTYVNWSEYFDSRTFSGGTFLAENYFVVPNSEKRSLCKEVGREADCFGSPKYDYQNNYIPPSKCDIRNGTCLSYFASHSPFQYLFLMDHVAMCGNACMSNINDLLTGLNHNPFIRQKWEDAIAKDIFLQLSTSKTRKVEKDWIMTRIEWNPTLFCQYARPNSDLLSQ